MNFVNFILRNQVGIYTMIKFLRFLSLGFGSLWKETKEKEEKVPGTSRMWMIQFVMLSFRNKGQRRNQVRM